MTNSENQTHLEFVLRNDLLILKAAGPTECIVGICCNIPYDKNKEILLQSIMMQWPKFSGSFTYPVPDPKGDYPSAAYHRIGSLWDVQDPYGQLRWELLNWCIDYLTEECKCSLTQQQ